MQKCDRCQKQAKIFLPYGPLWLCESHFLEFFEKRVRKTINRYKLVKPGEKIAVGVSGGKDSITALHLLKKIFPKGTEIVGVCIDEGIKGYRDKALKVAKGHFEELEVDYTVLKMKKELGFSMTEIAKRLHERKGEQETQGTCSYCGVFRRKMLNDFAVGEKCDKLATGHNLDDEAQTILMNVLQNDFEKFSRLGPITTGGKGFVKRIKPLYETPEKEIIAFTQFQGLKVYSAECCPFSWQAKRNAFRKALDEIAEKYPNAKHSAISFQQKISPFLEKRESQEAMEYCRACGMPSSGIECAACTQLKKLINKK